MVLVAASGSTSWVCDPSLESYVLEQPEMLRYHDYRHKCNAPFKCAPTVLLIKCYNNYVKTKFYLNTNCEAVSFILVTLLAWSIQ